MTTETQTKPAQVILDQRGRSRDPVETRVDFTISYGSGKTATVMIADPSSPEASRDESLLVRELHDLMDALDGWFAAGSPFIRT